MKSTLWKKLYSKKGILYVILDKEVIDSANLDIFEIAENLAISDVDIIQFRFKGIEDKQALMIAKTLSRIFHRRKRLFIVNDRADICLLANADGLHLGNSDIDLSSARKIVKDKIIGRTVHNLKELNLYMKKFDYISIGPIFSTLTKPTLPALGLKRLKRMIVNIKNLFFVIGGINLANLPLLTSAGIRNIAVCRGIILEKDIKAISYKFKRCLKEPS